MTIFSASGYKKIMNPENLKPKKTVIFDLGGVLFDWNPRHLYREMFQGDEDRMEYFLQNICPQEWNETMDAGRPYAESVAERISLYPEFRDYIQAFDTQWEKMLAGPIDETLEVFHELRAKEVPLYSLTNWSAEKFAITRKTYPFLNQFLGIVVSGEEKLVKPNPKIFKILLDRYSLEPTNCLYIDDVAKNVAAAQALNISAHQFTNAASLRSWLKEHDVLY